MLLGAGAKHEGSCTLTPYTSKTLTMKQACSTAALLAALASCQAFVGPLSAPLTTQNSVVSASAQSARAAGVRLHMSSVQKRAPGVEKDEDDAPDTEFYKRFGALKGRDVKTVSQAMIQFCNAYPKPIIPQYRTVVNDLIQSTHLSVVDARYHYDAVFALGLQGIFSKLMKSYPGPGEADAVFAAITAALDLDLAKVNSDAESMLSFAKGASEADILSALAGEGDSALAAAAKAVKADEFYLYSKLWGFGLIQIMEAAGIEVTEGQIEKFIRAVGFGDSKVKALQDLLQYRDVLDRTQQVRPSFASDCMSL
jgi:photosystem II biogenesis protein Psp29